MKHLYVLLAAAAAPAAGRAADVEFNRDVRPILSDACFSCHGFDPKARKARLRLDVPDGVFAARNGVVPIKAGDPKGSEVWSRVTSADADLVTRAGGRPAGRSRCRSTAGSRTGTR